MLEIYEEKLLDKYPKPVTIDCTKIILDQMKECICKINFKKGKGTGFFCQYKNNKLMITNNHIIDKEILIENNNINVSINDEKKQTINIELNNKKIYTNEKYDITIIEIKEERIKKYIELDDTIFEDNQNIYNEDIYILQYPESYMGDQKASVSIGILKEIQDNYNIVHLCSTKPGSSGSPIINISNNRVIGVHKVSTKYNYNCGTFLNYPIKEYLNNNNIIKKEIKIEIKKEIKKEKIKEIKTEKLMNYYDIIVDINSIKDIIKGWKIKMSKKYEEIYEKEKKELSVLKIGLIGNTKTGKSFLVSKLANINMPFEEYIKTKGLSIKYSEIEGLSKKIAVAFLDSPGQDSPVLKEGNEKIEDIDIRDCFKEKIMTQLFLQNYILHNSDLIIIVIGILTLSEQKLLNRIKSEMENANIKKPLIVIHNLMTYTTIDQVKEYIDSYLLKSASFFLEEKNRISKIQTKSTIISSLYYIEKKNDFDLEDKQYIYHLIFANDDSEAGNYYNNLALSLLEDLYRTYIYIKPFDAIETIKERFLDVFNYINQNEDNFSKENFDNENNKLIKLNIKDEKLELNSSKVSIIIEKGFPKLKPMLFEPPYNYYKKDNKIIVRIENPGNYIIKCSLKYESEYITLRIKGIKKKDKEPKKIEDNLFNSRQFGDFNISIHLKYEEYLIKNEYPEICHINGVYILKYLLKDKNSLEKSYKIENEEEI